MQKWFRWCQGGRRGQCFLSHLSPAPPGPSALQTSCPCAPSASDRWAPLLPSAERLWRGGVFGPTQSPGTCPGPLPIPLPPPPPRGPTPQDQEPGIGPLWGNLRLLRVGLQPRGLAGLVRREPHSRHARPREGLPAPPCWLPPPLDVPLPASLAPNPSGDVHTTRGAFLLLFIHETHRARELQENQTARPRVAQRVQHPTRHPSGGGSDPWPHSGG